MHFAAGVLVGIVNVAVVIGNALVLYALISQKSLRTPTNRIVLSLTCADFLLGLIILPFSLLQETLNRWIAGELWCRMWLALDVWFSTASIYHLLAISFDRFMAVRQPIRYPTISSKKVIRAMIFLCWFLSFLLAATLFVYESMNELQEPRAICTPMTLPDLYIIFSGMSSFVLPAVIMVVLNVFIFHTVLDSSRSKELCNKSTGATMRIHRGATQHGVHNGEHKHSVTHPKMSMDSHESGSGSNTAREGDKERKESSPPLIVKAIANGGAVAIQDVEIALNNNDAAKIAQFNGTAIVTDANGHTCVGGAAPVDDQQQMAARVHPRTSAASSGSERRARFSVDTQSSFDQFGGQDSIATFGDRKPDDPGLGTGRHPHTFFNHVMVVSLISTKRKKSELIRHLSHERKRARTLRTEVRVARTTGVVVAAFVICWFPFMTIYLLQAYKVCELGPCLSEVIFTWAFWLGYSNSAVNPLLYAACSRDFRAAIQRILGRKRPSTRP